MVRQQAAAFCDSLRRCERCRFVRQIKDYRPRTLRSLFGNVLLRMPRFHRCICERLPWLRKVEARYLWPGSILMPSGSTPELVAIYAALGARMPYREAAFLMSGLLPRDKRCCYTTVRNHALRVGERMNCEGLASTAKKPDAQGVAWASVAIDGTYVRACRGEQNDRFQIVAGRYERPGDKATLFAYVLRYQPPARRLSHLWATLGCDAATHLRVLTDGDRGLSGIIQKSAPGTTTHVLDWFHIAMRVQAIVRSIGPTLTLAGFGKRKAKSEVRNVERLRHLLWNGNVELACEKLTETTERIQAVGDAGPKAMAEGLRPVLWRMRELWQYLTANQEEPACYRAEHRAGQRISTSPVESAMNHLINHRMNKKQQMRWTPEGAHHLLQVRTALSNGTLGTVMARWYPGFGCSSGRPQLEPTLA